MKKKILSLFIIGLLTFVACTNEKKETSNVTEKTEVGEAEELTIKGTNIWIRESPSNGKVIMKLNENDKCVIIEKGEEETIKGATDYWYKISFEGKQGWVFGSQTSLAKNKGAQSEKTCLKTVALSAVKALETKKPNELNNFINSDYGIFKLFNPGAFLAVVHENKVNTDFFDFNVGKISDIKECKEPAVYDCEKEDWDKKGVFIVKMNGFSELNTHIKNMETYGGQKMSADEIKKGEEVAQKIAFILQITESDTKIYFAEKEGKYYIAVIDVSTPCDA